MLPLRVFACLVSAQEVPAVEVVRPNQRVEIAGLSGLTVERGVSVAQAAVEIILRAENIVCDKDSEVEAAAKRVSGNSLPELVNNIAGTGCVTDAGPLRLKAEFVPNGFIRSDDLIASVLKRRPQLIRFRDNLYVPYGVVYDEQVRSDNSRTNYVRQLLMIDPRYQDKRRQIVFTRGKDEFGEVEGLASIGLSGEPKPALPSRR